MHMLIGPPSKPPFGRWVIAFLGRISEDLERALWVSTLLDGDCVLDSASTPGSPDQLEIDRMRRGHGPHWRGNDRNSGHSDRGKPSRTRRQP